MRLWHQRKPNRISPIESLVFIRLHFTVHQGLFHHRHKWSNETPPLPVSLHQLPQAVEVVFVAQVVLDGLEPLPGLALAAYPCACRQWPLRAY